MAPDEFAPAQRYANLAGTRGELAEWLRQQDEDELFRLLYPLAVSSQLECPAACGAAMFLAELRPACPVSYREALLAALPAWDVGIREVPQYLVAVFGRHRVLDVVRDLAREPLPDAHISRLRQVGYHLRVPDSERLAWRGSPDAEPDGVLSRGAF